MRNGFGSVSAEEFAYGTSFAFVGIRDGLNPPEDAQGLADSRDRYNTTAFIY
jgi:hypothetical protein